MSMNWNRKVYGKKIKETYPLKWPSLKKSMILKSNFTCFRCDKKFRSYKRLSLHHIIPRSEDGSDEPENLIVLCIECHDFVEVNELRTKAEIIGSYDDGGNDIEIIKAGMIDDNRPDWHAWVYGGSKNPRY